MASMHTSVVRGPQETLKLALVVRIRLYEEGDLDACRALWVELTEWHRDIYESPEIGGDDPGRHFDEHLERVGAGNIWVAEEDGRIVGMTGLMQGDHWELEPISVSAGYRRRGVGRELAETVIAAARERGARTLQVRPAARNAEALRFFHELGFDILGQLELQIDFVDRGRELWRPGERLADRDFRV
jgi:ribosomal protein S18 acetylase RimI-like enzyme